MHVYILILNYYRSDGKIHDFAGSEYVSVDDMAFGEPYKYIPLDPNHKEKINWDKSVLLSDYKYNQEEHNIFTYYHI